MTAMPDDDFGTVLGLAIAQQDLTLERLSTRLRALGTPVSIATLSYWQSGRSIPTRARSLAAVEHLERILSLPPGRLSSALPGDAFTRWDPVSALAPDERIRQAIAAMGLDLNRHMATLSMYDSLRVDDGGLRHHRTTQQLVRSEQDGLRRLLVVLADDDADNPPGLEAGPGCSLGQVTVLDDISTVVAELVLPTPLNHGDLTMFEYRTVHELEVPTASSDRQMAGAVPYLVIDVTFDDEPPLAAEYHHLPRADTPFDERTHQELPVGRYLQMARRDAPAGVHGIAWTHDADLPPGHLRR